MRTHIQTRESRPLHTHEDEHHEHSVEDGQGRAGEGVENLEASLAGQDIRWGSRCENSVESPQKVG